MSRGFRVRVYRPAGTGDSTMGGVSSQADQLTVVGLAVGGTGQVRYLPEHLRRYDPADDAPAVALAVDQVFGDRPRLTIVPVIPHPTYDGDWIVVPDTTGHRMYGGNYVHATDSRWAELLRENGAGTFPGPVAVHDRIEPWR